MKWGKLQRFSQPISLSLAEANVLRKNGRKGSRPSAHLSSHQQFKDFLIGVCLHISGVDSLCQTFLSCSIPSSLNMCLILVFITSCDADISIQIYPVQCVLKLVSADALILWLHYKRWIVILYHITVLLTYTSHIVCFFVFPQRL